MPDALLSRQLRLLAGNSMSVNVDPVIYLPTGNPSPGLSLGIVSDGKTTGVRVCASMAGAWGLGLMVASYNIEPGAVPQGLSASVYAQVGADIALVIGLGGSYGGQWSTDSGFGPAWGHGGRLGVGAGVRGEAGVCFMYGFDFGLW